jgi:RNA polymerase sigma-70 factor, ECF subfamily
VTTPQYHPGGTTPRTPRDSAEEKPSASALRLEETVRVEGASVLATLTRTFGSLQLAEDAVQEAAIAALRAWPASGVPDDPRAWLLVTARNKAYDILRRESARPSKENAALLPHTDTTPDTAAMALDLLEPDSSVRDDMLRLIFTCCHPALAPEARVALALRTLAGLEVAAIARAFGVTEQTMTKRLVRTRQKIATAGIPYKVPDDAELPERLPTVLAVVYLIATEAHSPSSGDSVANIDYGREAIRLARLIADLMPGEPEILSLLALLLFTSARRPARVRSGGGMPVLLADQDRSLWERGMITEAVGLLNEAVRRSSGVAGPYQLQAHLAACHAVAPTWADTDWGRIVALYDLMLELGPNPAVALNRAVALGERDGPAAMLAAVDAIDGLGRSHLWHAARADALTRLDRREEAAAALRTALDLAVAAPDRALLTARLRELTGPRDDPPG